MSEELETEEFEAEWPYNCGNCRFWYRQQGRENYVFQCRRNSPTVVGETVSDYTVPGNRRWKLETVWPETASYDWCGRWEVAPD